MSTPGKPPLARAESTRSTPIKEMAAKLGSPAPVQTPPPLNRPASHSRTPSGNATTVSTGSPVTAQTPPPLGRPASLSRTPSGSFSATPQRPGSASASKPVESKLETPVKTPEKKDFTTVDVVCSKCIDLATDPVMSKCGHTYCRACFPLARGPCIRHGCHPKLAELCSAHPNLLKKVTGFQSAREGFFRAAKDQIPMLWNLNDAEITEKAAKVTEMLKALQASSNKLAADLDKFATLKPDEEKLRNEESGLIHTAKELEIKGHALREREDELRAKRALLEAEAARRREELQKLLEEFSQKKTQINTKEKELQEKDVLPTNETRHLWSNRDRAASLSPMITEADRARKQAEDELRKLDAQFKSDMDTIERELKETQQALVDGAKKMEENKLRLAKLHDRMQVIRVKRAGEAQAAMAAAIRALEDERSTFADSLPPELEPIISLLCQRANWFTPQVSLSRLRSVDFFQLCQHLEQLESPIEVLDLSGASLRDEHVIVLCEALRRNPAPRLKLLSLASNPLTDIAACALLDLVSRSPYLSNLQSIVLDNCRDVPQSTSLLLRQQLEMNNALKMHFPAPEGFADAGLRHLFETLIFGKADIIEKYASVRDELALKVEEGLPMGFSKPIPPAWTTPSKDKDKPPMTRASTKSLSN